MPPAPLRTQQIISIIFMTVLLVGILTMRTTCASGTAKLFEALSGPGVDAAGARHDR